MKHTKNNKSINNKSQNGHAGHEAKHESNKITAAHVAVEKKDRVFAVTSLVCGLLFWVPLFNFVLGPLAVLFGVLAIKRVRIDPERYGGQTIAVFGLILGIISVIFTVLYVYALLFRPELLITGVNATNTAVVN